MEIDSLLFVIVLIGCVVFWTRGGIAERNADRAKKNAKNTDNNGQNGQTGERQ